jgi:hypothetical protein
MQDRPQARHRHQDRQEAQGRLRQEAERPYQDCDGGRQKEQQEYWAQR